MAIRKHKLARLSGSVDYANYLLKARTRFEQGQAATVAELRRIYRRVAERVRRDIEALTPDTLRRSHLEALAANLERRARELNVQVLTATTRGIYLATEAGTSAAQNISVRLLKDAWPEVEVARLFAPISERAAMMVLARASKDGLNLSDRIWRIGEHWRNAIARVVEDGVARGLDARKMAREVQKYLQPGVWTPHKLETRRRLGVPKDVSYEAMRLARTEMNHAFHEASIMANRAAPSYRGVYWRLSTSHPEPDVCDDLASNMTYGEPGFYPEGKEPPKPHPQCFCYLVPAHEEPDKFAGRLREWMADPQSQPAIERWYERTASPVLPRPERTASLLPLGARYDYIQQYSLYGGTQRDVRERKLATGAKLVIPVDLDTSLQTLTEKDVVDAYNKLSLRLKKAVREIQLVDYRNPDDVFWERQYGIPGFRAWAAGGNQIVVIFANGHLPADHNRAVLLRSLTHEAAHCLDHLHGWYSESPEWTGARLADAKIAGDEWVSRYARVAKAVREDFADAVVGYLYDGLSWRLKFPNRSRLLWKKLMGR